MYPATQTFWLEPTGEQNVGLRRYVSGHAGAWTCEEGWHDALVITGTKLLVLNADGRMPLQPEADHQDPNWPTHCQRGCGYAFADTDNWQDWGDRLYQRTDTDELTTLRDAPPGACWDAFWLPDYYKGPDGIGLIVKCPNSRDWYVDSKASNCTRPDEPHKCWIRHGDPRDCKVTVDKNGDTCSAGAGSILAGDYHGFLQAGILTAG